MKKLSFLLRYFFKHLYNIIFIHIIIGVFFLQDVVNKWEHYVDQQKQYHTDYDSATKWLNDLNRQLSQCSDGASGADRRALEDANTTIQVGTNFSMIQQNIHPYSVKNII